MIQHFEGGTREVREQPRHRGVVSPAIDQAELPALIADPG
jgi:hypothetical protein